MNKMAAMQVPTEVGVQRFRVMADDYLRMIDAGAFGDAHVELIDGELIEMASRHSEPGRLLMHLGRVLGNVYAETDFILYGDIITIFDETNIRAPDIAVVDRDISDRKQLVPADILLAVEIGGSTLNFDLGKKRIDYASAGIRHYWVVDIAGRRTYCYTAPQGADYSEIKVFPFGEEISVPGVGKAIKIA